MPRGPSTYPLTALQQYLDSSRYFRCAYLNGKEKKRSTRLSRKTDPEESFYAWLGVTNKKQVWIAALCTLIYVLAPSSWTVLQSIPSEPQPKFRLGQSRIFYYFKQPFKWVKILNICCLYLNSFNWDFRCDFWHLIDSKINHVIINIINRLDWWWKQH